MQGVTLSSRANASYHYYWSGGADATYHICGLPWSGRANARDECGVM